MATLDYIAPGTAISYVQANALYDAFSGHLNTLLGGRTPALAFKTAVPYRLLGKCFFFNDGVRPTPHSKKFTGYAARTASVPDPIYGAVREVEYARPYQPGQFQVAADALAQVSRDEVNHILVVADAGAAYYADGLPRVLRTSLWDHDLCVRWRTLTDPATGQPARYYLREASCYNSERVHRLAVAEIVIENLTALTLPSDPDGNICSKYCCLRFHNCSPEPCVTNLGTVPAYGCVTLRRDWNASAKRFENLRWGTYFWPFAAGDAPAFANAPWQPEMVTVPFVRSSLTVEQALAGRYTATTPHAATAANNLANFGILYDWALALSATGNYAQMDFDVREVCDLTQFRDGAGKVIVAAKWDCIDEDTGLIKAGAVAASLLHHRGTWLRARVHRTEAHPTAAGVMREEFAPLTFGGWSRPWAQIVGEFAAAGVTLAEPGGRLRLTSADSVNWFTDVIQKTTNFLRQGSSPTVAASLDDGIFLEDQLFEGGAAGQDHRGLNAFTLNSAAGYKVLQKAVITLANSSSRTYYRPDGTPVIVTGPGTQAIQDGPVAENAGAINLHRLTIEELLTLKYFGDSARASQDDDSVRFESVRLVLTPGGWRMLFTESVRGDLVPDVRGTVNYGANDYHLNYRRPYRFNNATGRWELDHCVRLRGHGWGYWEHGSQNALFHARARQAGRTFSGEVQAANGADVTIGGAGADLAVDFLQEVTPADLSISSGTKIFKCAALDSLNAFFRNYTTAGWYQTPEPTPGSPTPRERLLAADEFADTAGNTNTFVRLSWEHINALIEVVNQLVPVKQLDWRGLVFVQHTQVLRMDWGENLADLTSNDAAGLQPWWKYFGSSVPAPLDAFFSVLPSSPANTLEAHWRALFAGLGISESNGATDAPPSVAERRTQWNTQCAYSCAGQVSLGSITEGGFINVLRPNNSNRHESYFTFNGDVRLRCGDFGFGAVTNFSQGIVTALPDSAASSSLDLNLYAAKKWIGFNAFKAWCSRVGMPFTQTDIIEPLTLDRLSLSRQFDSSNLLPGQRDINVNQRVFAIFMFQDNTGTPFPFIPPSQQVSPYIYYSANALEADIHRQVQVSGPPPYRLRICGTRDALSAAGSELVIGGSLVTDRLAFRPSETPGETDFKLPVRQNLPPEFYRFRFRDDGRMRFTIHAGFTFQTTVGQKVVSYGLAGLPQHENPPFGTEPAGRIRYVGPWSASPDPDTGRYTGGSGVFGQINGQGSPAQTEAQLIPNEASRADWRAAWNVNILATAWRLGPPPAIEGITVVFPVDGQSYSGVTTLNNYVQGYGTVCSTVAELATPENNAARSSQERFAAWLHHECRVIAAHMVSTDSSASLPVVVVGQGAWGVVPNWWLADSEIYISNMLGGNFPFGAGPIPTNTAPRLYRAATIPPQAVTCAPGVTLMSGQEDVINRLFL